MQKPGLSTSSQHRLPFAGCSCWAVRLHAWQRLAPPIKQTPNTHQRKPSFVQRSERSSPSTSMRGQAGSAVSTRRVCLMGVYHQTDSAVSGLEWDRGGPRVAREHAQVVRSCTYSPTVKCASRTFHTLTVWVGGRNPST